MSFQDPQGSAEQQGTASATQNISGSQRTPEPGYQNSLELDVQPSIPTVGNGVRRFLRGRGGSLNTEPGVFPVRGERMEGGHESCEHRPRCPPEHRVVQTPGSQGQFPDQTLLPSAQGAHSLWTNHRGGRITKPCGSEPGRGAGGASSWDRWGPVLVSTGWCWEAQPGLLWWQESDRGGRRPASLMKNSQKVSAHSQDSQGEAWSQDKHSG